jgi:hypothetical protein
MSFEENAEIAPYLRPVQLLLQRATSVEEIHQLWDNEEIPQDAQIREIPDHLLMSHPNARRLPEEGHDECMPFEDYAWNIENYFEERDIDCHVIWEREPFHHDHIITVNNQPVSLHVNIITGVTAIRVGENLNTLGHYTPQWPIPSEVLYDLIQANNFLAFFNERVVPFINGESNSIEGADVQEWTPSAF